MSLNKIWLRPILNKTQVLKIEKLSSRKYNLHTYKIISVNQWKKNQYSNFVFRDNKYEFVMNES